MLRLAIFHIFAIALAFSRTVWGVPITDGKNLVARGGTCLVGCTAGTETFGTLTELRDDLEPKLQALDDCYTSGTDPTNVMNEIMVLFNTAGSKIRNLPIDMTGQLNGKASDIIDLWTAILTILAEHFDKWNHKSNLRSRGIGDIFAGLSAQVAAAVAAAQGALTGALGGLQTLGSQILDASKPHWEQLLEQLLGQGLNVLGSLSETINNIHGSITG
ncbi:hypothetical protein RSOLAG22IIIB_10363 [Rhizoctonia solani]|uniref:Secreted protein n=1 Tax=Rhizoctonia solani TaxID=456999 RepID=A0A0K6G3Q5_9AGAM|nr:hypothetical protein RSOLAG22IIIB_10363 [Rhizoctonia solani]